MLFFRSQLNAYSNIIMPIVQTKITEFKAELPLEGFNFECASSFHMAESTDLPHQVLN